MKHPRILPALLVALALGVGFAVWAQDAPAPAQNQDMNAVSQSISGTVVSSTGNTLVIKTDAGDQMTFNLDAMSERPASLTAGSRVGIQYHTLEGGKYHAASVKLEPASGAAPPSEMTSDETSAADRTATEPRALPGTASPLPLYGLGGLLSFGTALGLRFRSRRRRA